MEGRDVKQLLARKYIIRRFAALFIIAGIIAVPAALGAYSFELGLSENRDKTESGAVSNAPLDRNARAYIDERLREISESEGAGRVTPAPEASVPDVAVGTVLIYAGDKAPDGFLKCDGKEVSRSKYGELYAVIGDRYGDGDGVTTFNLPDLDELPVGGAVDTASADAPFASGAMTTTAEFAFSKVSDASGSPPVVDLDEEERYDSEDQYVPSEEARPSMCFIIKY